MPRLVVRAVILLAVAALGGCDPVPKPRAHRDDAGPVRQYDLANAGGLRIHHRKGHATETTVFDGYDRGVAAVFAVDVFPTTGEIYLNIRRDAPEYGFTVTETKRWIVDCRSAVVEYDGVTYPMVDRPVLRANLTYPMTCDAEHPFVDAYHNDRGPPFYSGAVSIRFKLEPPLTAPIVITLPNVDVPPGAESRRGAATVEYRLGTFDLPSGAR
jgi:hypothetical protein